MGRPDSDCVGYELARYLDLDDADGEGQLDGLTGLSDNGMVKSVTDRMMFGREGAGHRRRNYGH